MYASKRDCTLYVSGGYYYTCVRERSANAPRGEVAEYCPKRSYRTDTVDGDPGVKCVNVLREVPVDWVAVDDGDASIAERTSVENVSYGGYVRSFSVAGAAELGP